MILSVGDMLRLYFARLLAIEPYGSSFPVSTCYLMLAIFFLLIRDIILRGGLAFWVRLNPSPKEACPNSQLLKLFRYPFWKMMKLPKLMKLITLVFTVLWLLGRDRLLFKQPYAFFPPNPMRLGEIFNHRHSIFIRLWHDYGRSFRLDWYFLSFDFILDVILDLNQPGPTSKKFYWISSLDMSMSLFLASSSGLKVSLVSSSGVD